MYRIYKVSGGPYIILNICWGWGYSQKNGARKHKPICSKLCGIMLYIIYFSMYYIKQQCAILFNVIECTEFQLASSNRIFLFMFARMFKCVEVLKTLMQASKHLDLTAFPELFTSTISDELMLGFKSHCAKFMFLCFYIF